MNKTLFPDAFYFNLLQMSPEPCHGHFVRFCECVWMILHLKQQRNRSWHTGSICPAGSSRFVRGMCWSDCVLEEAFHVRGQISLSFYSRMLRLIQFGKHDVTFTILTSADRILTKNVKKTPNFLKRFNYNDNEIINDILVHNNSSVSVSTWHPIRPV